MMPRCAFAVAAVSFSRIGAVLRGAGGYTDFSFSAFLAKVRRQHDYRSRIYLGRSRYDWALNDGAMLYTMHRRIPAAIPSSPLIIALAFDAADDAPHHASAIAPWRMLFPRAKVFQSHSLRCRYLARVTSWFDGDGPRGLPVIMKKSAILPRPERRRPALFSSPAYLPAMASIRPID